MEAWLCLIFGVLEGMTAFGAAGGGVGEVIAAVEAMAPECLEFAAFVGAVEVDGERAEGDRKGEGDDICQIVDVGVEEQEEGECGKEGGNGDEEAQMERASGGWRDGGGHVWLP